ncbi:MAG TPA: sugar phosphate nucleotidyltransferase [Gemmatimonadales bacterium]|nr:sugar phosphate nucleotidyltransferase [Gemmatimonadales bacterium]
MSDQTTRPRSESEALTPDAPLPGKPDAPPGPSADTSSQEVGDVGTLTEERPVAEELPETDATLWAVILAGGIGSRFWPLSSPARPKQVLPLVNERPLIADAVVRLQPLIPAERVLVVTSHDIADALHAAIPSLPRKNLLVEPRPLGTAAALALATQELERRAGPETAFVVMHADLAISFPEEFRRALRRASGIIAREDVLLTLGARPTRPETGFGYALAGDPIDESQGLSEGGACRVARFVEKPAELLAEALIGEGALWHTGIIAARVRLVQDEIAEHARELHPGLEALRNGQTDRFAGLIQSVSVERGLLERSWRVAVLPCEMGWDDVGTWASLRRCRALDDSGNGAVGVAHFVDAEANVVHTENGPVVVYGCSGMLVVAMRGLTFVTPLERAADLGALLKGLPEDVRGWDQLP